MPARTGPMSRPGAFGALEPVAVGELGTQDLPTPVCALLDDADARIAAFRHRHAGAAEHLASFVPSASALAFRVLRQVVDRSLPTGRRFCEWGSGFGVAACAAAWLGLDATGIELQPELVAESERLARDHGLAVRFVTGSYRPPGTETESVDASQLAVPLGFSPVEFDLVYAYPWPAEERLVAYLFGRFAPRGALLITYHGGGRVSLWRRP